MNENLLVKIESEVIRNVIDASGLTTEYVSEKVLHKPTEFLNEALAKQSMPKTEFVLLCNFFRVGSVVFLANGKVSTNDSRKQVSEKMKRSYKKQNTIDVDANAIKARLKKLKINMSDYSIEHGKSVSYLSYSLNHGKIDKDFYNELVAYMDSKEGKVKPAETKPTNENNYSEHVKALIKKTGKTQKDVSIMCGMSPSYISYCLATGTKLNDKVYNKIVQLAEDTSSKNQTTIHSIPKAKTTEIFQEVVPEKIDLVKVTIDNKSYVLVDEEKFNKLIASLTASTEILEYVGRLAKEGV